MDIILLAGLWLPRSIWDEIAERLGDARHRPVPVALPGVDDAATTATLVVRLADPRRFDVPVLLVCPEFSPEQARSWIDAGEAGDLTAARHVSFVDIDSGHWPMVTRRGDLARILGDAATHG